MKKVLIVGSSGAGKSTFAVKLGQITGIEVVHLDRLHWLPGWTEPSKAEWKSIVENALSAGEWIMDGNYGGTMEMRLEKCDTVIFLDLPRILCVYRILKRVALYRRGTRPDMADGCDERFDWEFLKWVWNYPTRSKPKVAALLAKATNEKTIYRLRSRTEVEKFLMNLAANRVKSV